MGIVSRNLRRTEGHFAYPPFPPLLLLPPELDDPLEEPEEPDDPEEPEEPDEPEELEEPEEPEEPEELDEPDEPDEPEERPPPPFRLSIARGSNPSNVCNDTSTTADSSRDEIDATELRMAVDETASRPVRIVTTRLRNLISVKRVCVEVFYKGTQWK